MIRIAYLAIFASILFFVLSCVLGIPHDNFVRAKAENLNVLSVMKGNGDLSLIYHIAPLIAIIGMTKSFLGVGLSVAQTFGQLAASVSGKGQRQQAACLSGAVPADLWHCLCQSGCAQPD